MGINTDTNIIERYMMIEQPDLVSFMICEIFAFFQAGNS